MKFRIRRHQEEPEINLIPLIDVLLVILIFLMVTTTYSRFAELQINLPTANAEQAPSRPEQINVGVDAKGSFSVNQVVITTNNVTAISNAIKQAGAQMKDPTIVINADANAAHQTVVRVMEAAQMAGYSKITFTTQGNR